MPIVSFCIFIQLAGWINNSVNGKQEHGQEQKQQLDDDYYKYSYSTIYIVCVATMNLDDYKKLGENLSGDRPPRLVTKSLSLDDNDQAMLDENSWNTSGSLHSRSSTTDQSSKSWNTLDSIHSRTEVPIRSIMDDIGNSSLDFGESMSSFASIDSTEMFGESQQGSSPLKKMQNGNTAAVNDLIYQSKQFRSLSDGPSSRTILNKQQNLKFQRSTMKRCSLTLIEESTSLD